MVSGGGLESGRATLKCIVKLQKKGLARIASVAELASERGSQKENKRPTGFGYDLAAPSAGSFCVVVVKN